MDKRPIFSKIATIMKVLGVSLFLPVPVFAASNFTIAAILPLPTTVVSGQTITASYTMTNMTSSTRSGYVVVGLPTTVTQDTSNGNCPASITLSAGASCNLKFIISGAVHSLFAVCKGSSCTTADKPLNVSITPSSQNLTAVGLYFAGGFQAYPFLAQSSDGGITWLNPINSQQPTLSDFAALNDMPATSCSNKLCVAAGSYFSSGMVHGVFPLLAQAVNNGSWSYKITSQTPSLPSDYGEAGQFLNASCSGSLCVAGGSYVNNHLSSQTVPLLAQTTNNGSSWSYVIDGTTPPLPSDFDANGKFNSTNCNGAICLAGGEYNNGTTVIPLVAQTINSGGSWGYVVTRSNLPSDFDSSGAITSVSVGQALSIAAGFYRTTTQLSPLLGQSSGGGVGTVWIYPIDAAFVNANLHDYANSGQFNSASCAGRHCIAGGFYRANAGDAPLLAQTLNGGGSWSFVIDDTNTPNNWDGQTISFNSVSCSETMCVAGGSYGVQGVAGNYPLLAQSTDGGHTWTYVITSETPALPSDFARNGAFSGVNCNGSTCIAAGAYISTNLNAYPLLAETTDGGDTWSYAITSAWVNLPSGFSFGIFESSSAGPASSSLLPRSMQWFLE